MNTTKKKQDENSALMSKAEMKCKLEQARKDILAGNGKTFNSKEELSAYLKAL